MFASRKMSVFSRVWLSENDFRRALVDDPLFHYVLPFLFPRRTVFDKVLVLFNVSRFHLFCTIISYSEHKRCKEENGTGK